MRQTIATGAWVPDPIDVTPGAASGTSVSVSGASRTLAGVSGVLQAITGGVA